MLADLVVMDLLEEEYVIVYYFGIILHYHVRETLVYLDPKEDLVHLAKL